MQTLSKFIQGPAGQLELSINQQNDGALYAVICHPHPQQGGTMHNKVVTTLARAYQKQGMNTICFNYRGVGKSEGIYGKGYGESDDLQAVLAWLLREKKEITLHLAGFSFGTFVVLHTLQSLTTPVESVVLVAPPVHNFECEFQKYPTPCLIVQSEDDEVVPAEKVYEWIDAIDLFQPTVKSFSKAGHFFHGYLVELRTLIITWLQTNGFD